LLIEALGGIIVQNVDVDLMSPLASHVFEGSLPQCAHLAQ